MINAIIDAISVSINTEFGDDYAIYTESLNQGLKEPCFFIFCLNPTQDLFLNNKYFRKNQFCIQYIASGKEINEECNGVSERLFNILELITVTDDVVRGTKLKGETVDGVLNFFINYDMFVYKVEDKTLMEVISTNVDAKG